MYRQTFVVEYANEEAAPRVGADTVICGGRLVAMQFSDALREIELLRDRLTTDELREVDALIIDQASGGQRE